MRAADSSKFVVEVSTGEGEDVELQLEL